MEEGDVTALVVELVEYSRVLDASFDDQNPLLFASVATQLWEMVSPLREVWRRGRSRGESRLAELGSR